MGLLGTLGEALETKGLDDAVLRVKGGFSVLPSAELRSYMCSQLQGKGDAMLALDEWSEPPFNGFVDVDSAGEAAWMEDACTELAAALLEETEVLRRSMRWTVGGCAVPCGLPPAHSASSQVAMVFCRRDGGKSSAHVVLAAERGFGETGVVALLVLLALAHAPQELLDAVDLAPYGAPSTQRAHLRPPMSNKSRTSPCYLRPHALLMSTRTQRPDSWDTHLFRDALPEWVSDEVALFQPAVMRAGRCMGRRGPAYYTAAPTSPASECATSRKTTNYTPRHASRSCSTDSPTNTLLPATPGSSPTT